MRKREREEEKEKEKEGERKEREVLGWSRADHVWIIGALRLWPTFLGLGHRSPPLFFSLFISFIWNLFLSWYCTSKRLRRIGKKDAAAIVDHYKKPKEYAHNRGKEEISSISLYKRIHMNKSLKRIPLPLFFSYFFVVGRMRLFSIGWLLCTGKVVARGMMTIRARFTLRIGWLLRGNFSSSEKMVEYKKKEKLPSWVLLAIQLEARHLPI